MKGTVEAAVRVGYRRPGADLREGPWNRDEKHREAPLGDGETSADAEATETGEHTTDSVARLSM